MEFIPLRPKCGLRKRTLSEFTAVLNYLAVRKARKLIVLTDQIRWEVSRLYGRDALVARGLMCCRTSRVKT
jgi:hypothetical protein